MIEVVGFSKPGILKDVTIEIPAGITFLKGKNGTGKTTLLDCIAGLDRAYSGEIRGVGDAIYLNQHLYFYGRLRVKDLIEFLFGLDNKKNPISYYESHMRLKLKRELMLGLYQKQIGKVSGGEMKLFYFSVITAMDREWYLFDEPYAQVDEEGKEDITGVFEEFQEEGKNIIITSHEGTFLNKIRDINVIDIDQYH